ncbi:caspase family protein [Candidatus Leptofilum sp.]|uniref:caspase family protein n=1 Tax=Candidatus Leptofilum sp. TaxID=3241576 RepID=UPI003B5C7376
MEYFEKAYALVIGINNYKYISPLHKAVNDATDLAAILTDTQFCGYKQENVHLLVDEQATAVSFQQEMEWLANETDEKSTITIFFSGHGAQDPENSSQGYLLLHDTDPWTENRLKIDPECLQQTAISTQQFTIALNKIKAQKITIFFDACHSGGFANPRNPFFNREKLRKGLPEQAYEQLQQGKGRVIIASCTPDQVSWEKADMRNGIFSDVLFAGLKGEAAEGDSVHILTLFRHLSHHVPQAAKEITNPLTGQPAEQNPYLKAETKDDYRIALSSQSANEPTTQAPPVTEREFDIFISYSHKDIDKVRSVIDRLKKDGYSIWWDEEQLGGGDVLVKELAAGVKKSKYVMIFLSHNYLTSEYGELERIIGQSLDVAASENKLIPIKLDDSHPPDEIPHLVYVNLPVKENSDGWERSYKKSIKNIKKKSAVSGEKSKSLGNGGTNAIGKKSMQTSKEPTGVQNGNGGSENGHNNNEDASNLRDPDPPFANQVNALLTIEQRFNSSNPFIYISATAQMGKTFLLKEIKRRCSGADVEAKDAISPNPANSEDGPNAWLCFRINLKKDKEKITSIEEIIAILIMRYEIKEMDATAEALAEYIALQAGEGKRLLLLVNGTEYFNESVAQQFLELLQRLKAAVEGTAGFTPAVVTVGRRSFPAWERTNSPMKPVELEPFTFDVVLEMLQTTRANANPTPPRRSDTWHNKKSNQIHKCAAGHPRCIATLLQYVRQKKYTVPDLNSDDVFRSEIVPVMQEHILTPANLDNFTSLSGDVADMDLLSQVFLQLSIFRIVTPELIELVLGQLGIDVTPEKADEIDRQVEHTLLIRRDRYFGWNKMPRSVRQLLVRWLILENGNIDAHYQAFLFYDARIRGSSLQGLPQIGFIREALFHEALSLQGSANRTPLFNGLQRRLIKYGDLLKPGFPGDKVGRDLRYWLHQDDELHQLIDELAHVGAYEQLIDSIEDIP